MRGREAADYLRVTSVRVRRSKIAPALEPYQIGWRIACSLPCVNVENLGKDWYLFHPHV